MVFCGTSYMDGVIYGVVHVHIVGCLFELWGLRSFDRGWIERRRDSTEFHSAQAGDIVSFKAALREHGNLQHCLSQEKQHSIVRTIFATDITGRRE